MTVFDVSPAAAERLKAFGAKVASSPAEAAAGAAVVMSMVPSNPHVRKVYTDAATGVSASTSLFRLCVAPTADQWPVSLWLLIRRCHLTRSVGVHLIMLGPPHPTPSPSSLPKVFGAMSPGTLCIDSSTIDPAVSIEMAAAAAEAGGSFIDAPVSGGECL